MRINLIHALPVLTALIAAPLQAQPEAAQPQPRNVEYEWMSVADWYRRHADDVEAARLGRSPLVFAGDSITQGWEWAPSYQQAFGEYEPVNLGIGGDRTENLLWRLQNSATGRLDPKAVVLMIGVNNFGHRDDDPRAVFEGIKANVEELKHAFPQARILVLGVLPWGEAADSPNRKKEQEVNKLIATLRGERVETLDLRDRLLETDGSLSKEVMGDFLHPTEEGYRRITAAVQPTIQQWLQR